jgi:hypothetical protein
LKIKKNIQSLLQFLFPLLFIIVLCCVDDKRWRCLYTDKREEGEEEGKAVMKGSLDVVKE